MEEITKWPNSQSNLAVQQPTEKSLEFDYAAVGLSSAVGQKKHVIMMDLDSYTYERVCDTVKELIETYCFSDAYIIRSSAKTNSYNWHVIFLDILDSYERARGVVEPYVDGGWLDMCDKRKEFTVRVSPRIFSHDGKVHISDMLHFMTIAVSPYQIIYVKSNAHKLAIEKIYGVKVKPQGQFNKETKTKMVMYTMGKPVEISEESVRLAVRESTKA